MFKTSWIIASVGMLTIWIVAGITLFLIKDSQFLTNWINSAVAIGTIGAVVTSLYLANNKFNYRGAIHVLEPLNQRHSYLDITCCNKTDREINFIQAVAYNRDNEKIGLVNMYINAGNNEHNSLKPYEQKTIYLKNVGGSVYTTAQLGYFLLQTNFGFYKLYASGKCVYAGFRNNITRS